MHKIKDLSDDQQILFVKLRLQAIFERWKLAGPTPTGTELRHIVMLDEAPKYFTDDTDDIINVIGREARKFGIGLWCGAQAPTAFPDDFLTNCGATVLLGIHTKYRAQSAKNLGITEESLRYIRPKEVLSVQLRTAGRADPPFINIAVPNPNCADGRVALQHENGGAVKPATTSRPTPGDTAPSSTSDVLDEGLADEILLD